jgi:hypothetical protein
VRRLAILAIATAASVAFSLGHTRPARATAGQQNPGNGASVEHADPGGWWAGGVEADDELSATVTHKDVVDDDGDVSPSGGGSAGPERSTSCETYEAPGGPGGGGYSENGALTPVTGDFVEDDWYYSNCTYDDTGELAGSEYWQYSPNDAVNPGPDLEAMARRAHDQVPFTYPAPMTSPGIDVDQITGLPTWLWIDPADWHPLSARSELSGFWVEVTAEPQRVIWDMGDGTVIECDGPGTPYDPAVPDDAQSTDCEHIFQDVSADEPDGRYAASATVDWAVSWEASTGATGELADTSRTTTFGLTVTERQAVVTYGS